MDKQLKQLESTIAKLQAKKDRLIRSKAIPNIIAQMRQVGVTPQDIADAWGPLRAQNGRRGTRSAPTAPKQAREPKYRNPETGETWGGMGKRPFWIRDAEEAGHSREEFLIEKNQ